MDLHYEFVARDTEAAQGLENGAGGGSKAFKGLAIAVLLEVAAVCVGLLIWFAI